MWTPETLAIVAAAFLLAGMVKGVVGMGLPTVALPVLTIALGLKEAIALIVVPALITNVWQGLVGGAFVVLLKRLWTLLAPVCIGAWFGVGILAGADATLFSGLLGLLLCTYAAVSLATPQIPAPGRREWWLSPTVGGITGIVTGLTGTFVVPGVLYLQALGLSRDLLVQAMGISFTVATLALALGLRSHGLLPAELGLLSAAGVVPALLGMLAGQQLRRRLSEARFRTIFFSALLLMGCYLAIRAIP